MTKKLKNIISAKSKVTASIPKSVSFFDTLNNKTIYIVVFITTLLAFLLFKDFILSRKVYLFRDIGSDTLNANLPYLELILRYFKEHGTLSWSFSNGMGQSIFPLFLRDPFDLLTLGNATKLEEKIGIRKFSGDDFFRFSRVLSDKLVEGAQLNEGLSIGSSPSKRSNSSCGKRSSCSNR